MQGLCIFSASHLSFFATFLLAATTFYEYNEAFYNHYTGPNFCALLQLGTSLQ